MNHPRQASPIGLRERIENLWYYKKVHIIVAVALLVVGLATWGLSRSSGPPTALNVVVIDGAYTSGQTQLLAFERSAAVAVFGQKGAPHKGVHVEVLPVSNKLASPNNEQQMMSFIAQVSGRELDVLILDPADYRYFAKKGSLMNLKSVPRLTSMINQSGAPKAYGLLAAKAPKLKGFEFPKGSVVSVVVNSQHKESAFSFLRWLYKP